MSRNVGALPFQDPLVYPPSKGPDRDLAYLMTDVWQQNLGLSILQPLNQAPYQFPNPPALEDQNSSIGTTAIPLPSLSTGLYRVSVFARVTQAATVSSSLTVTISGTDDGVSYSLSTTALTTNTTASVATPQTFLLAIDQATPISYSTTYASVGATPMQYKLLITVEAMPS